MSAGLSAAAIGGIVAGVGAVGAAVISSNGAKSAANTQANSANYAADLQNQAQQQMRTDLEPYTNLGSSAINPLLQAMGYKSSLPASLPSSVTNAAIAGDPTALAQVAAWTKSYNSTPLNSDGTPAWTVDSSNPLQQQFSYAAWNPANLAQTPGYQFTLQQGLKGVTNSNVARGLGLSGAQLKGISDYTTGNADNTYSQQYQNYLAGYGQSLQTYQTNYNSAANNVNRLAGLVQQGQNSAAQVGTSGINTAANAGNLLTSGANAQAASTVAGANAASGALTSVGNNALLTALLKNNNASSTATSLYGSSGDGSNSYNFQMP
ncbi:hypothetical protein PQQ63_15375 [Paraburkholderia metrosideri]|uniref:DNA transfer protein p32 n=1 Tax=Paraburkholderia metrosideri TaxID=580937 RepID=A0ABW9DSU1_9BURK